MSGMSPQRTRQEEQRAAVIEEQRRTAARGTVTCAFCDEEIAAGVELREAWPEVSGYAEPRTGGGVNALAFRRTTGRLIHASCGRLARATGSATQGALL